MDKSAAAKAQWTKLKNDPVALAKRNEKISITNLKKIETDPEFKEELVKLAKKNLCKPRTWDNQESKKTFYNDLSNSMKTHWTVDRKKMLDGIRNRPKREKPTSSKYKGVCWDKQNSKWQASIGYNNKVIRIGRFKVEEDAARAYDRAALKYFGENAIVNFPNE